MAFDIEASAGGAAFDVEIGQEPPDLATGTTIEAVQAGSVAVKYTVAIEGYEHLLTDATAQQAIDAWYGNTETQHFTSALSGLHVTCDFQQQLDWRVPFPRGGTLMLHVSPDTADTFGIATHKREADAETEVTTSADRDAGTLAVKSTTGFDASGEAFCGTECFEYSAVGGTSFTVSRRGKYAALSRDPLSSYVAGDGFSQDHRIGTGQFDVQLSPRVTSSPTKWDGKWVAVYLHKYDPSIPALNSKDNAWRVFAGKIVSITDDPATGCTVVEVKHALDAAAEHTIGGRDPWSGKILNLIELRDGMTFRMKDQILSGTSLTTKTATNMVVGGANGFDPVAGLYTPLEIYAFLNAWWSHQKNAGNLSGVYNIGYGFPNDVDVHSDIYWTISSSGQTGFTLEMPNLVSARIGFFGSVGTTTNGFAARKIEDTGAGNSFHSRLSEDPIMRSIDAGGSSGVETAMTVENEGTFTDQQAFMPGSVQPLVQVSSGTPEGWGIFVLDEAFLAYGWVTTGIDGNLIIHDLKILPEQFGFGKTFPDTSWRLPLRKDGPDYVSVRQIFALEMSLGNALLRFLKSTGTSGYNDATWDTLGYGLGAGIPWEIADGDLDQSVNALPHNDKLVTLLIDKPIKLSTLLEGELIVRRAFLRWNNETGKLEFKTWQTPSESNFVAVLNEANKAAPSGNIDHNRSVSTESAGWAVPIVNLRYNRALNSSPGGNENYLDTLVIVDQAAVSESGGDGKAINIDLRGTFGDFASTGQTADSLAAGFMATMPYFSRAARTISRSIDQRRYYLSIGDVVLFEDSYARDPSTGLRGVSRYGLITRHRFSFGGFTPNSDSAQAQGGDVDLFTLDVNRVAAYVPCAQVNEGATNGGYNAGTKTLTCYEHKHSESTEPADLSRFENGFKVRIIEIDPADPASPLVWDDVINGTPTSTTCVLTTGLAGWSSTKRYRLIFDDYSDATTTERLKCFQADDADGKIQNLRVPYEYGVGGGDGLFTYWTSSDMVELPPNGASGDGVPRDVGHEVGLVRLLNNLNDYKLCVSSPCLANAVFDPSALPLSPSEYWLIQCGPVYLGADMMNGQTYRKVSVAPHFASLAGATARCRVTLSRTPPTGSSLVNVGRGNIIASTEFTTTSTTFATPTPVELDARVKDGDGIAWVYVEINEDATCWGLSHLQVTNVRYIPLSLFP